MHRSFHQFSCWFFSVIAGALVAIFTYNLVSSTDKLWRAGNKTLETTERAFVFLDGFNVELTPASSVKGIEIEKLPKEFRDHPDLYITRFALQPRWKNSGNTPTKKMSIRINWRETVGVGAAQVFPNTPTKPLPFHFLFPPKQLRGAKLLKYLESGL